MRAHVQHQIVLVLGLFVAHRTLELGLDATLEALVAIETVRPRVRVAASVARECAASDHAARLVLLVMVMLLVRMMVVQFHGRPSKRLSGGCRGSHLLLLLLLLVRVIKCGGQCKRIGHCGRCSGIVQMRLGRMVRSGDWRYGHIVGIGGLVVRRMSAAAGAGPYADGLIGQI